jgi:ArsR family transcriptional regulator
MAKNQATCDCNIIHEDVVNEVKGTMPDEPSFTKLSNLFKIFADNNRLKILWVLSQRELCVCDIAALMNMSKSAVSHKLNTLRLEKMVDYRKEGRIAFYFLINKHIKILLKNGFSYF